MVRNIIQKLTIFFRINKCNSKLQSNKLKKNKMSKWDFLLLFVYSQAKEQRAAAVAQCLDDAAKVRLGAIAAVKPERAAQLENVIIGSMQQGKLQGKVTES